MPRKARTDVLAEFRPPPAEQWPLGTEAAVDLAAAGFVHDVQAEIELRTIKPFRYELYWVSWELLRRSPLHWEAFVSRRARLAPTPRPSTARMQDEANVRRALEAYFPAGVGSDSLPPAAVVPRGHRFPPPTPDGSGPSRAQRAAYADAHRLVRLLNPVLAPPVILREAVSHQPTLAPTDDYVQIYLHRDASGDAVNSALDVLRRRLPTWRGSRRGRWIPRPHAFWSAKYHAVEVIDLLDTLAAGGELKPWVRRAVEARYQSAAERDEMFESFKTGAHRLRKRLRHALRENPLLALIGSPRQAAAAPSPSNAG